MMKHRLITLTVIFIAAILFAAQAVQAGELHYAAEAGNLQKVKQLLSHGADVNAKGEFSQATPLHWAASGGKTEVAKLLISQGADVNARNKFQRTPLHLAASMGKTEFAGLLIRNGADVNARDEKQRTPIFGAVASGKTEATKLLISKGADVNARSEYQRTPIFGAAREGKMETAELLISMGVDVNAKDKSQNTPLHDAAYMGHIKMSELLIRMGADVNAKNYYQDTPSMEAEKRQHSKLAEMLRQFSNDTPRQELNALISRLMSVGHRSIPRFSLGLSVTTEDTVKLALRLAKQINPQPTISEEAQEAMARGIASFKLARIRADFERAAYHFEKAFRLAPWWPDVYFNLAMVAEKLRLFEVAKGTYNLYLIANPDAVNTQAVREKIAEMDIHIARAEQVDEHIEKANQHLANKNRAGAIEEIREAVRLEPDNARNHFALGHVLANGGKHHAKEAITELKYAEHLGYKSDYNLYWNLGSAYTRLDEDDAAIESYKKAIALTFDDKERAILHSNIGRRYEKKNNSKKALEHFKLAQKLGHPKKDYIKKKIRHHKRLLGR